MGARKALRHECNEPSAFVGLDFALIAFLTPLLREKSGFMWQRFRRFVNQKLYLACTLPVPKWT